MSRKIAIVEDEPAIRENYTAALGRYGYDVQGYESRGTALGAFRTRLPDLVIIDVGLMKMGGCTSKYALHAAARQQPQIG